MFFDTGAPNDASSEGVVEKPTEAAGQGAPRAHPAGEGRGGVASAKRCARAFLHLQH